LILDRTHDELPRPPDHPIGPEAFEFPDVHHIEIQELKPDMGAEGTVRVQFQTCRQFGDLVRFNRSIAVRAAGNARFDGLYDGHEYLCLYV